MRRKEIHSGTFDALDVYAHRPRHQRGFSALAWLLATPAFLIALLILAVIFYEGRKAYWDGQVKEMCAKDGGVTIYESTSVPAKLAAALPKIENSISIPHQKLSNRESPLFSIDNEKILREWEPKVVRRERVVIRQIDSKVVGKIVGYSRIGGDFPTGFSEGSSFACPEYKKLYAGQALFFKIEGEKK